MELKIYSKAGVLKATVSPDDNSYIVRELPVTDNVGIGFTLDEYIYFLKGDYIDLFGRRYTLPREAIVKETSTVEYAYTLTFEGVYKWLDDVKYFEMEGTKAVRPKFDFTATPLEFLTLLVKNLNRDDSGWTIGQCINAGTKPISFAAESCLSVLSNLAGTFETEYWIDGKVVNLAKCELASAPLTMAYGTNLLNIDKQNAPEALVTRLYAYGSTRNITDGKPLEMDIPYLERNTVLGIKEDTVTYEDVYPRRIGTVNNVRKADSGIFYFVDNEMLTLGINPNALEVPGLTKKIVFQSGRLNGIDFDVNYNAGSHEFEIILLDSGEGIQIPSGALTPNVGDTYVLYNIKMPEQYVTLARAELKARAQADLNKLCVDHSVYKCTCNPLWFEDTGAALDLGLPVRLESPTFFPELGFKESRITGYRRNLNNTDMWEPTISDIVEVSRIGEIETKLDKVEQVIDRNGFDKPGFTLRNWRDISELMGMLKSIQAEVAVIGTMAGNFELLGVYFAPQYNGNVNIFSATSGTLKHNELPAGSPGRWLLSSFTSVILDIDKAYYLYAMCSKATESATYELTETRKEGYETSSSYIFEIGILSAVRTNCRIFNSIYGNTIIVGNRITAGIIQGKGLEIDLDKGEIEGRVKITSGSGGLGNLSEWQDAEDNINDAKQAAEKAQEKIADIASDNKLTPVERSEIKGRWDIILSEYATIVGQAAKYGISTIAYNSAFLALDTYLHNVMRVPGENRVTMSGEDFVTTSGEQRITAGAIDLTITTDINGPHFRSLFQAYSDQKMAINKAITDRAKELSDAAQGSANKAQGSADKAQGSANNAQDSANTANSAAANAQKSANNAQYAADTANGLIPTSVSAAKDALARNLGYSSSAGMQLAAEQGETIIEGGKIRTGLIEAVAIVTKGLSATMISALDITTSRITITNNAKIGAFTIDNSSLYWNSGGAKIRLGYSGYYFDNSCIYAKSDFSGSAIVGVANTGGAAIYGSSKQNPTWADTSILAAGWFDGDVQVRNGNVIVKNGVIQADRMLPQNGWSGSFRDRSVTVVNGIIINVS